MEKIKLKTVRYGADCKRIQDVLVERGLEASLSECEELWSAYSDSLCAGWMMLPDSDEEIYDSISYFIDN
jgi:hypothetical protein